MNRREFMNRLESCLTCIERSEREAALRYYEEYFDDAGPDKEAEVISSLGTPEGLAREIIAQEREQARREPPVENAGRRPCEFHSIRADVVNANVTILRGNEWSAAINYPDERVKPEVSLVNGVLTIKEDTHPIGRFFRPGSWRPGKIDITVPNVKLSDFKIEGVNGTIVVAGVSLENISCGTVNGAIELSDVTADSLHGESVNGDVTITACRTARKLAGETVNGTVTLGGELRGNISAEAVNGTLRISSLLPITDYDIDVETVSGSVRINGEKHRKEVHIVHGGKNRIKVEAVNGSISLDFGV